MRPIARTVQEIFQPRFFRVPRFQRPFSWEEKNLDDFWVDIAQNNPPGYFIGPIVFFSEGLRSTALLMVNNVSQLSRCFCAL